MKLYQKLILNVLQFIYRTDVKKLSYELSVFYNEMLTYVADMKIKPALVTRALHAMTTTIPEDTHKVILEELGDEVSVKFTDLMRERQITLKSALLNTEDILQYYKMIAYLKQTLWDKITVMLQIKLLNAMAEVDFRKTFGMTREEWNTGHREQDVMDPLIQAVKEKKPLPEEIRRVLEEVNGIVPLDFDYDAIN